MVNINVKQLGPGKQFQAVCVVDGVELFDYGVTASEAIGNLIQLWGDELGLKVQIAYPRVFSEGQTSFSDGFAESAKLSQRI
jgi:hypothetical protein